MTAAIKGSPSCSCSLPVWQRDPLAIEACNSAMAAACPVSGCPSAASMAVVQGWVGCVLGRHTLLLLLPRSWEEKLIRGGLLEVSVTDVRFCSCRSAELSSSMESKSNCGRKADFDLCGGAVLFGELGAEHVGDLCKWLEVGLPGWCTLELEDSRPLLGPCRRPASMADVLGRLLMVASMASCSPLRAVRIDDPEL